METVDVLVQVWDRGRTRREVVPVEEECFSTGCWKQIACIKAAVLLEMSFAEVERLARYGFRQADKLRLFGKKATEDRDAGPSASAAPALRTTEEET